jgi:hypothetical protein
MAQKKSLMERMKEEMDRNDHNPTNLETACSIAGVILGTVAGFALMKYNDYQYGSGNFSDFWMSTKAIDALAIGGLVVGNLTGSAIDYLRGKYKS